MYQQRMRMKMSGSGVSWSMCLVLCALATGCVGEISQGGVPAPTTTMDMSPQSQDKALDMATASDIPGVLDVPDMAIQVDDMMDVPDASMFDMPPELHVPTPLARATNEEVIESVRALFDLSQDSSALQNARGLLVSEANVGGLTSNAEDQTLTHITVSGYWRLGQVAMDAFLVGVENLQQFDTRLGCEARKAQRGLVVDDEYTREMCLDDYAQALVGKAYRRPLAQDELEHVRELLEGVKALAVQNGRSGETLADYTLRMQMLARFVVLSPEFLLFMEQRGESQPAPGDPAVPRALSNDEIATRMSYFLTGTLPDNALLVDARVGRLDDPAVRMSHAERLLSSPQGQAQFVSILSSWLGVDPTHVDAVDVAELNVFLLDWFVQERPFSDLYQASVPVQHVDGTAPLMPLGVLGHRAYVGSHTFYPTPAFITRGVFFYERQLCSSLSSDVPALAFDAGEQTDLEVFENHDKMACAVCHVQFDNYGAMFQRFDGETSLYDEQDDELGSVFTLYPVEDVGGEASNVDELAEKMGQGERAADCMSQLWYRHAMRRALDEEGGDEEAMARILTTWRDGGNMSIKALLRTIVLSDEFVTFYP